jgi:hypothetical protein
MAARAEDLDALEACFGDLPKQFSGQFSRYKGVCRE